MLCIVELSNFITVALINDPKLVLEFHHHLSQPLIIQLKCLGFSIVALGQLLIRLAAVVVFLLPYEH
jgi:E3 ubiquitin-protein ligase DOA10